MLAQSPSQAADNPSPAPPPLILLPVAVDDFFKCAYNTTCSVPAPGLLANDYSPNEGARLAVVPVDPASTLSRLGVKADGSLFFVPPS